MALMVKTSRPVFVTVSIPKDDGNITRDTVFFVHGLRVSERPGARLSFGDLRPQPDSRMIMSEPPHIEISGMLLQTPEHRNGTAWISAKVARRRAVSSAAAARQQTIKEMARLIVDKLGTNAAQCILEQMVEDVS